MGEILLVTGTDTGVGKTIVAAWLASVTPPSQRTAIVKAVQTGASPAVDGDEAFYRAALGQRPVTTATLVSLPEPLAPSIAARRVGRSIGLDELVRACLHISETHHLTIVEGTGGLLVPIDDGADFTDLARALKAALVVVIRPGLGTLNHTLLTLEAAASRGLRVEMLVCSGLAPDPEVVETENLRFLHAHYPSIPIIVLQRLPSRQLKALSLLEPRLIGSTPPSLRQVQLEEFSLDRNEQAVS